jgi:HTH-type transcriptional regulator/antitoxin HigA
MENIRPIRNEDDYDWALAEIERYFEDEPDPGTAEADRFDVLTDLIEAYESRAWPIEAPDPVDALRSYIDERHLTVKDLADVLGSAPRATEILRRKRPLNLRMIQKLTAKWNIPAEVLIAPSHLDVPEGDGRRAG